MAQTGPHVSIKAETVANIYGFPLTNSLITSLIVTALFALLAMYYNAEAKKKDKSLAFYAIQGTMDALNGLFNSILGNKAKVFFTLLASFFFFIILNNWFGLLPGVNSYYVEPTYISSETAMVKDDKAYSEKVPLLRAATADLNTTLALALITVIFTQVMGFKYLGAAEHLSKYASGIGVLEAFSEISRILSFAFRLFGNIFAGEVMLAVVSFLIPFLTPPFFLLEVFVGFIQAVVFTMLSAVFINMAISKHH
jgi:F-type H+-transporting ATPase subunit a